MCFVYTYRVRINADEDHDYTLALSISAQETTLHKFHQQLMIKQFSNKAMCNMK